MRYLVNTVTRLYPSIHLEDWKAASVGGHQCTHTGAKYVLTNINYRVFISSYSAIEVLQGARPSLNGFSHHQFSQDLLIFCHFEGQRYQTFHGKNHRHYCDLNANQVCYAFCDMYYHISIMKMN